MVRLKPKNKISIPLPKGNGNLAKAVRLVGDFSNVADATGIVVSFSQNTANAVKARLRDICGEPRPRVDGETL